MCALFYYKGSKSSNILLNIKLSEVFERNQGVPNGDERETEEKSERSPKFRKERLPRINQLFFLDLKQKVLCSLQNPTVVSLAVAQIPNPSTAPNPDGIGCRSPISLYFLYLQGFLQPVSDEMVWTAPNSRLL